MVVNDLKVRPNQPEGSDLAFKVRSRQKPHGWSRFWSREFDVRDENLCHLFSPEKCPVVMKRSRTLEMVSNLQRNIFDLKVRHRGSQSSIFVRTLRSFTTCCPAVYSAGPVAIAIGTALRRVPGTEPFPPRRSSLLIV